MKINWFMMAAGTIYIGATVVEVFRAHWVLSIVYVCYGISAFALATV